MPHGDVDTNIPSNECIKLDDDEDVVGPNAQKLPNGSSGKRTAQDILSNDVLVFESDEGDNEDDIKGVNSSYEDEAVISKEKYMKQKKEESSSSAVKVLVEAKAVMASTAAISTKETSAESGANILSEPGKSYQPRVIKYETPGNEKKGKLIVILSVFFLFG